MTEVVPDRSRLTPVGGMSGAIAGLAMLVVVTLYPFVVPLQFEPSAILLRNLTNSQSQTMFRFVFWALAIIALLTVPTFLGLYRLLRTRHPGFCLSAAVIAIVSVAMNSVSMIIYSTTLPVLGSAYGSVSDQDLLKAIEFQASAFDALATATASVGFFLLGLSLVLWSRTMNGELRRYRILTVLLGFSILVTVLPLALGQILPLLIVPTFEGVWLVVVGVKMAMLSQQRTVAE